MKVVVSYKELLGILNDAFGRHFNIPGGENQEVNGFAPVEDIPDKWEIHFQDHEIVPAKGPHKRAEAKAERMQAEVFAAGSIDDTGVVIAENEEGAPG